MKRVLGLVGAVAIIAAINLPAFAIDDIQYVPQGSYQRAAVGVAVNPVTGEQRPVDNSARPRVPLVDRTGAVYDTFDATFDLYFSSLGSGGAAPGRARADDLLLDKHLNPGAGMKDIYTYIIVPTTAGAAEQIKLDVYAAQVGPYQYLMPSVATKLASVTFNTPSGTTTLSYILHADFTNGGQNPDGLAKPDMIWLSLQSRTGRSGPILKNTLPVIGTDWLKQAFPTVPTNRGYFAQNLQKDNDLGWVCCYSFGGPAAPYGGPQSVPSGDFAWLVRNVPEPASMAFVGAAALAFFRRRR